jgi:rare lipoprotein A
VVFGKQYRVMPTAAGYREQGTASWYGVKFHGRPTSSGERYDMYRLTAAHKSLPIPTYVRVTNLDNQKSTVVRVNDRGPFHEHRIIDLSYAGAVKLGFADRGTARVLVEVVDSAGPTSVPAQVARPVPTPTPATAIATAESPRIVQREVTVRTESEVDPGFIAAIGSSNLANQLFLQAGAFSQLASAERLQLALADLIGDGVHIHQTAVDELYRVRIGPVEHMREATRLQALIVTANYGMPLIVRDQ